LSDVISQHTVYFPTSVAAPISPAYDASWTNTASADRLGCVFDSRVSSGFSTKSATWGPGGSPTNQRVLVRQYVSTPLPAGHFLSDTGALTNPISPGYVRCHDISTGPAGPFSSYTRGVAVVWIAKPDGTLRNYIGTNVAIGLLSSQTLPVSGLIARTPITVISGWYPSGPGAAPTYSAGDYLVFEFGFQPGIGSTTETYSVEMEFGDSAALNLINGVDSLQHNPWWRFQYWIAAVTTAIGGWTFLKPNVATIAARRMQSPSVEVATSTSLNDFILS
jgi:hypothetical protein